jgi:hypothetical protein
MPNPKSKVTIQEINSQFYQLSMIDSVSSNGYVYRLDIEEHDSNVQYARIQYNTNRLAFEEGNITSEEYQTSHDMYMECLEKYNLIDEDRKICGEYSSKTKNYQIYYWRFILENKVYYHDEEMEVWTYTNCYVGHLSDDMREIIRDFTTLDVASDSEDDDNYDEDDDDEDDEDDDEDDDYDP